MRKALLALLLVSTSAFAQKPPTLELGFSPERMYSFGGLDNINAFNGNNVITLPLTLNYPVSNNLTYTLSVVYNSKAWDYRYYVDEFSTDGFRHEGQPNLRSNAGVGWRVSMGRLLAPTQYTASGQYREDVHGWLYEGPSGDEHQLSAGSYGSTPTSSTTFSSDGVYLRMVVVNSTTRTVEFPNGQIHTFSLQRNVWRLAKISDQHQNTVSVTYSYLTTSSSDSRVQFWTITDSTSRQHVIKFKYYGDMADTVDRGMNVDYLDMQAVAGATARYTFNYTSTQVNEACGLSSAVPSVWFPLLTSIALPDETKYAFAYNASTGANCAAGLLQSLTLPTLGVLSYTYQPYIHPPSDKCSSAELVSGTGVKSRTLDDATWQYLQTYGPAEQTDPPTTDPQFSCGEDESGTRIEPELPVRWARTSILTPADAAGARSRSDNYFSVHSGAGGADRLALSVPRRYGAPYVNGWPGRTNAALATPPKDDDVLDESAADTPAEAATTRALSQQVWSGCDATGDCTTLLRSTYGRDASIETYPTAFRQLQSSRTVFHDDSGCGDVECYIQQDKSDFDRVGNWRTNTTSSNYPDATSASSTMSFRSWTDAELRNAATKWVFATYTETSNTANDDTATAKYCFSSSGLLLRARALVGATEGAHDLLTTYTYNSGGNLTDEKSYGGDKQSLAITGDLCTVALPTTPEYWTNYTYANGVVATVAPRTSSGAALTFKSVDYVTDSSGFVTSSTATDGLVTSYAYKSWGAIESVTPPGESGTTYTYTAATATAAAKIVATRDPDTNTTGDEQTTTYEYDPLGRVRRTERTMPGAGCVEQIVAYDKQGRRDTAGVWKPCNATGGGVSYRYDALGRPTTVTAPDGKVTTFAYTGARLVVRGRAIGDHASVLAREEYDQFGRLISVTDDYDANTADGTDDGITARYTYDVGGRLTSVAMQKNPTPEPEDPPQGYVAPPIPPTQVRSFTFDNRGFLKSEQHPELGTNGNGRTTYIETAAGGSVADGYDSRGHSHYRRTGTFALRTAYDAAERVTSVTDAASNRVLKQFAYDTYGACEAPLCAGKLAAAARYHYDADLGHPTTQALAVTEGYQYDALTGRLARYDRTVGSTDGRFTGHSFNYAQTYDTFGNVLTVNYPCPTATGGACDSNHRQRSVTNAYSKGVLTGVSTYASNITYQASGMIDTVTHGSGSAAVRETWTADPHGMPRPRQISAMTAGGATHWTSGLYTYDGSGNVTKVGNTSYAYDRLERLSGWTEHATGGGFATVGQVYDDFGNFRANTYHGCGPAGVTPRQCYTSSVLAADLNGTSNQYMSFTYDDAGNVLNDRWSTENGTTLAARTFTYDSLGSVVRSVVGSADLRFLYTPDDERIAAVQRVTGSDGVTRNGTTYTLRTFGRPVLSVWSVDAVSGSLSWK